MRSILHVRPKRRSMQSALKVWRAYSPPRRGGEDAPSAAKAQMGWREARARQGEASIEARRKFSAGLPLVEASPYRARASRPARQLLLSCRAIPPLPGGEALQPIRHRNYEKQY